MRVLSVRVRPCYVIEGEDWTFIVEFIPSTGTPGFTHRVAVNRKLQKMWLAEGFKPNGKSAVFFLDRYLREIDGMPGLEGVPGTRHQRKLLSV